jgi:hypothetical protein
MDNPGIPGKESAKPDLGDAKVGKKFGKFGEFGEFGQL